MLTFTTVTNLKYVSADHQIISMMVKFDDFDEAISFVATANDVEEHGRLLFEKAIAGDFGSIAEFTPSPTIDVRDTLITELRATVTKLLNDQARSLQFESMADALTYVDEPIVPLYQQQALALRSWRSLVWAEVDAVIATDVPFNIETVVAALPQFTMPE